MLSGFKSALFGLFALTSIAAAQQLQIHYINVSWGGSVLVIGPDGTTVLLEAGDTGKGNSQVVPYLNSIGLTPAGGLDYTIIGHQHCDHVGGMDEVINAGYNVHVKNYYNGSSNSSSCVTQWNSAAAGTTAGAPVSMPVGTVLQLGLGATLTCVARNGQIIGGSSVSVSDENDRSIAVLVQYGGFDYLWASDLGGGNVDSACTGRSTTQADIETPIIMAITPGGSSPLVAEGGIDVLHVNHHGSESSTNSNWKDLAAPSLCCISTGAGQSSNWFLPRIDVVDHVLRSQSTSCVESAPALVLQTEEGSPTGSLTSFSGYCVGDIVITTDGVSTMTVSGNGQVTQGPNEVAAAALPRVIALDEAPANPWINEFHYDNVSTDTGEFIEVAGRSGTSLVGWTLFGYDGSSRNSYQTVALSGTIPSQSNGFGTRSFAFVGLQNGSPDGMALVNASGIVVQFLSYEGTFTALNGPAAGLTSTGVGPSEGTSTPVGQSLRLTGSGCSYANFAWQAPATSSAGAINAGQSFLGTCP